MKIEGIHTHVHIYIYIYAIKKGEMCEILNRKF